MNQSLCIAMGQCDFLVGDLTGNAAKILEWSNRARDEHQADLIIFPELALNGYPPEDLLLRPQFAVQTAEVLNQLMQKINGIYVLVGHIEQTEKGLYDAASVFYNGKRIASYYKQYLPNYSVFDEKRYFISGEKPCVFELKGIKCGVVICEDVWFQEPAAQSVKAGAQILLIPNASPFHSGKETERTTVLRSRIREQKVPIVYVQTIGGQDELVFDGGSMILDKSGEICYQSAYFKEELSIYDLPIPLLEKLPRAEMTAEISDVAKIYEALKLGVKDYFRKNGFTGAVIGLSGGIDSALTLAVAVDALGAEQVEVLLMPSRYTAEISNEDAKTLAETLKVQYHILPIEEAFKSFLSILDPVFKNTNVDVTEENIQARCRGVLLMALSNKKGKLVLTTGNKSEMAVGYATLYGDMAGGFAVLKDVPKTLVYQLVQYRNSLSPVIPQRIIDRPPTAELRSNQKDEDSLPPYAVLDAILEKYIENDLSPHEIIAAGFDADVVYKIVNLINKNEYKRRQAPPGIRITRRAFGRDRRYPISSGYHEK